ncbi:hypothetical protein V8G54_037926, partial (chloroplast) [Vigna mungo]
MTTLTSTGHQRKRGRMAPNEEELTLTPTTTEPLSTKSTSVSSEWVAEKRGSEWVAERGFQNASKDFKGPKPSVMTTILIIAFTGDNNPSIMTHPTFRRKFLRNTVSNGLKTAGLWKPPRYTDTRVDEVFAAKKPRLKIASGKENEKKSKGKALRGLAAPEEHYANDKTADLADGHPVLGNFLSECNLIGQNVRGSDGLHSWMYPQSILPYSLISVLSLSTPDEELDLLRKRQVAWEESFWDLYYMLRKDICSLFYVCTTQFVVMFTSDDSSGKSKCSCNAYISQSTQGLRSLLREH